MRGRTAERIRDVQIRAIRIRGLLPGVRWSVPTFIEVDADNSCVQGALRMREQDPPCVFRLNEAPQNRRRELKVV
jgi:hypothetical protein